MIHHHTNSLYGVKKKHSTLREVAPIIEQLKKNSPVNQVGVGIISRAKHKPVEPIEIKEMRTHGRRHYMRITVYNSTAKQEFYLFCHKRGFPKVVDEINKICAVN